MKVVDFFCGAGGFSEGFRQMGFNIVHGYDYWKPAVDTYNYNFELNCTSKNIQEFWESIEEINKVENTEVIIGSPPCVSFSSSNKSGKADKSLGVRLTEAFLRVVAVKKYQPNSILKAWFMENVVNSKKHLKEQYNFIDLNLKEWAEENNLNPLQIAIDLTNNTTVINSADYGSIQARKRLISGEIIRNNQLVIPVQTHNSDGKDRKKKYRKLKDLLQCFPTPFSEKSDNLISDIQYDLNLAQSKITDHFYDSGIYESEWSLSKFWKTNHPFMGKMSFPENQEKPSRTITATKIANSRESIIYKTEIARIGDGEYRLPTVREASIIMGFPITYQFVGLESSKWRLVGNAVCCSVSRAFATQVLQSEGLPVPRKLNVRESFDEKRVLNLNNYLQKEFLNPPQKKKGSRFRRHAIKEGNLTVTLSNYDIEEGKQTNGKWYTSIQYGTGDGFPIQKINNNYFLKIEDLIRKEKNGEKFLGIINNGFSEKIPSSKILQNLYEKQIPGEEYHNPILLVDKIKTILNDLDIKKDIQFENKNKVFKHKSRVPLRQLFALYAINKISTTANQT
ncbi:DNA cytosine methyltransferase [Chryseobacterium manosquense]|uniref:DNA (cytosine-5-)-methyltransferase n=2 Tax=Chryseobacterium manosquense TaxID=2754694 RepID=A0A7H1E0E6_9FLAO|nr:DNA cytosine methyltransferase [Chryseobacterium sp. NEB161]QNS42704.1 DNA cytosine methyltransferase [Chryseobacterium manosquense]